MSRPYLVGLAGVAGVGKDTAAGLLCFPRYAFARPIKNMLAAIGLHEPGTREGKEAVIPLLGFSYRQAAQTLGTEWGRSLHSELWLQLAKMEWEKREDAFLAITDVRFENEAHWVRENGTLVHIRGRATTVTGVSAAHASEAGLAPQLGDMFLDNSGDMDTLREQCLKLADELWRRRG